MASKSLKKEIAKRIATLERIIQADLDKPAIEAAKQEIVSIPTKYHLTLIDMMEIDDMIQEILNK